LGGFGLSLTCVKSFLSATIVNVEGIELTPAPLLFICTKKGGQP